MVKHTPVYNRKKLKILGLGDWVSRQELFFVNHKKIPKFEPQQAVKNKTSIKKRSPQTASWGIVLIYD